MLVEMPAWEVISRLLNEKTVEEIADWCCVEYDLPIIESQRFVAEVHQLFEQQLVTDTEQTGRATENVIIDLPKSFFSVRRYSINDSVFRADFETAALDDFFHPQFMHLACNGITGADHHFQVFFQEGNLVLRYDHIIIGMWKRECLNFLSGRLFMELLNSIHQKTADDWMAVFHASAVSDGQQCLLFLGDSGNGKSTLSAILMANGFHLLADDFVPVDAINFRVHYLPAALSVKKSALGHLVPLFPQLATAPEYFDPYLNKTFRYLANPGLSNHTSSGYPCKALVFVKYEKDSGLILEDMPKDIAFQSLVPSSWISPLPEVASRFLDWFLAMPCYRLTYSDNEAVVGAVRGMLEK